VSKRRRKGPTPRRNGPTWTPDEAMEHSNVPPEYRWQVAAKLYAAKLCALTEVALELNGGEPVPVRVDRIKEILGYDASSGYAMATTPSADGEWMIFHIAEPQAVRDGVLRDHLRWDAEERSS
jgi:hypothetical protein